MSKTHRSRPFDRAILPSLGPTPVGQRNRARTIPARRRPAPDIHEWADEHQRDPIVSLVDRLEYDLHSLEAIGPDPLPPWREASWAALPIAEDLAREQFRTTSPDLMDHIIDEYEARHG